MIGRYTYFSYSILVFNFNFVDVLSVIVSGYCFLYFTFLYESPVPGFVLPGCVSCFLLIFDDLFGRVDGLVK